MDRKDTLVTSSMQKADKGDKGDKGESGQRGPSGLDVSMITWLRVKIKRHDEDPQEDHIRSRWGTFHFDVYHKVY